MAETETTLTKPIHVTDDDFTQALQQHPALVIDCWAEWCGPCRMLGPVIEELAQEMAGQVVFGKLDVDQNERVSLEYRIQSIPTLLLFQNGKLMEVIVGFKPKAALRGLIQKAFQPVN